MDIRRNFKFRIYPNSKQARRIDEHLAIMCKAYNEVLNEALIRIKEEGAIPSNYDLKDFLVKKRQISKEYQMVYCQAIYQCTERVTRALKYYNDLLSRNPIGARKRVGHPRYKKSIRSITYPQNGFKLLDNRRLHISRYGSIRIEKHRDIIGRVKTLTILKKPSGQYFAILSCQSQSEPARQFQSDTAIGIDLGLTNLATLSDSKTIENPRVYRCHERKLKRLHRLLSRKQTNSKNWQKSRQILAREYQKVEDARNDYLHKVSRFIISRYHRIGVETLNIPGLCVNRRITKSIADASWGKLLRMIHYKAESAGNVIVTANLFEPTSKQCSRCGAIVNISLAQKQFACEKCGFEENRDINAALNLLKKARAGYARSYACGDWTTTPSEKKVRAHSLNQEPK
jgi:putative transposase